MSYSSAYIEAFCDHPGCSNSIQITLTETGRGWDSRDADRELEDAGWKKMEDGSLICDFHAEEEDESC